MKKIFNSFISILIASLIITPFSKAYTPTPVEVANQSGYQIGLGFQPEGAIQISHTGQVLYEFQINNEWPPASMSKLMTMYLVLEAEKEGKLSLNDTIKITDDHYRMSTLPELSNTKLYPGETYTIKELLQICVSASSNAAALILATEVSETRSDFTDKMNAKAKKIGMKHTHYVNPAGASNRLLQNYAPEGYINEEYATTTAKDYAILAQRAVSDTPKIIDFTKQVAPTQHGVTYYTYNHSLEGGNMSLEGTDGLKTGSSDVADYNHAITTKRDGLRIYQIILGAGDYEYLGGEKERNKIGNSLMNNAFNQYKRIKIFSEGVHTINDKKYYVSQDFYDILPVNMTKKDVKYVIEDDRLHIDYERTFISDAYGPPTVKLEQPIIKASKTRVLSLWESHPILTIALGTGIIIVLAVILKWLFKRVRK